MYNNIEEEYRKISEKERLVMLIDAYENMNQKDLILINEIEQRMQERKRRIEDYKNKSMLLPDDFY